jgi:hypothetical protein
LDRFLKTNQLTEDFSGWIEQQCRARGQVKNFADGTLEVYLKIPVVDVARFLKERMDARRKPLDPKENLALKQFGGTGIPVASSAGVGLPEAAGWVGEKNGIWKRYGPRRSFEVANAAYRDAKKNLLKKVEELQIGEKRHIRAFLVKDPLAAAEFRQFVSESIHRGPYPTRYYPDGKCEIDVFLSLEDLRESFLAIARNRTPPRSPWREVNEEYLQWSNGGHRILWARGAGLGPRSNRDGTGPRWAHQRLTAEGKAELPVNAPSQRAAEAQAADQAVRGARANALKKILDLRMPSGALLKDIVGAGERKDLLQQMLQKISPQRAWEEGKVYFRVIEIPLEKVWKLVKDWK